MEGWDGTDDGRPTDLVRRRWQRFGTSGAGLVWGGEAFAVRPDGRANGHQLCQGPSSADDLAELHALLDPGQVTGLQLTHSGRWSVESRPPRTDPLLDQRRAGAVLTASELDAHRRRLRQRRPPRAGRRLRLRRRQGVPRLPPPRAAVRARRARGAHGHDAHDHRARARRGHPGRRAALHVRPAAPPGRGRRDRRTGGGRAVGLRRPPRPRRPPRRRPALRHRREPLLLPPRPAAGLVPTQRRLRRRRRIPSSGWPGCSTAPPPSPPPVPPSRSSPPGSPTSRSGCRTWPRRACGRGAAPW